MEKAWKIYFVHPTDGITGSYVFLTYGDKPLGLVQDFKISTKGGEEFITLSFSQILLNNYEIKTVSQKEMDELIKNKN